MIADQARPDEQGTPGRPSAEEPAPVPTSRELLAPDKGAIDPPAEDRFARVASNYDRWVGWGARLEKEMPFLMKSLPVEAAARAEPFSGSVAGILDVGCGTGAHAIALAVAGHRVTGLDRSPAMLEQARRAEAEARRARSFPAIEWVEGDVSDPAVMPGRWFRGVLALGNVLPAFGEEEDVYRGLEAMVRSVAPGGVLILQYLNGTRIRHTGRLVVKSADANPSPAGTPSPPDGDPQKPGDQELWLRHHFEVGGSLYFHSYTIRRKGNAWSAEVQSNAMVDVPPERLLPLLEPRFDRIDFFDGLSERPYDPLNSDSVGVRASGRR